MMVNIDKRIGDFSLNANIGASIKDLVYEQMGNEGDLAGIPNFFTVRNINYESNYKPKQFGYHDQSQGVFANIELGWRSMAYLTLTGRNDWESQLAHLPSILHSFILPSEVLSFYPRCSGCPSLFLMQSYVAHTVLWLHLLNVIYRIRVLSSMNNPISGDLQPLCLPPT